MIVVKRCFVEPSKYGPVIEMGYKPYQFWHFIAFHVVKSVLDEFHSQELL